jgi:hypothetical protein
MQARWLPQVAQLERARRIAQPLLTEKRSGGQVFVAPRSRTTAATSRSSRTGRFLRGEISIDLYLANARTGKRIGRLTNTLTGSSTEELRLLYSQSNFSPDSRRLAFVSQRRGKDVLNVLDVRRRKIVRTIDRGFEQLTGRRGRPTGRRIVFSASRSGLTDLWVVDADGDNLRQLTNDKYGDLQPSWSPDGRTIAFASDRGPGTSFEVLRFDHWQIATLDVASGRVAVLPGQSGLNLNPQWAPDGRSLAFVSDRAGTANVFLYDLEARDHYQLTNLVGVVGGFTEYSPAISWARGADRLAFSYLERASTRSGRWRTRACCGARRTAGPPPRRRRSRRRSRPQMTGAGAGGRARAAGVRAGTRCGLPTATPASRADSLARRRCPTSHRAPRYADGAIRARQRRPPPTRSYYRGRSGVRASDRAGRRARAGQRGAQRRRAARLRTIALPDTVALQGIRLQGAGLQPDYVAQPSLGVAQDNFFGRGVFGGTPVVLSDLLGNSRVALSGQVNGRFSDAQLYAGYTQLGGPTAVQPLGVPDAVLLRERDELRRRARRAGSAHRAAGDRAAPHPADGRHRALPAQPVHRFEGGMLLNNVDRSILNVEREVDSLSGRRSPRSAPTGGSRPVSSYNYAPAVRRLRLDNTLSGITGSPLIGRRHAVRHRAVGGTFRVWSDTADYRRYDPILFNFLTVGRRACRRASASGATSSPSRSTSATRSSSAATTGRTSAASAARTTCSAGATSAATARSCSAAASRSRTRSSASRSSAPRPRLLPITFPAARGARLLRRGVAWSRDQTVNFRRASSAYDIARERYLLTSYGAGLRLNLFGFAIVRWDYAIPLDVAGRKGFWTWSVGPSF